jgi:hypothetical protein
LSADRTAVGDFEIKLPVELERVDSCRARINLAEPARNCLHRWPIWYL